MLIKYGFKCALITNHDFVLFGRDDAVTGQFFQDAREGFRLDIEHIGNLLLLEAVEAVQIIDEHKGDFGSPVKNDLPVDDTLHHLGFSGELFKQAQHKLRGVLIE